MNLKLTLGIHFKKRCLSMILSNRSRDFFEKWILVCKLYTVLLLDLLRQNANFLTGVKVDISSKKLHTRTYLEKSRDHIHDVLYRPHLSRGILKVGFQLTSCRETCV